LKRTLVATLLVFMLCLFSFIQPSLAADLENGAKLFKANCIGCHLKGNNSVMQNKTLKQEALEKYGMYSIAAITTQVTNGKNGMPAFGKKLVIAQPRKIDKNSKADKVNP